MGRLLFLILSLCFLCILINFTLGDVRELFNHPKGDRRRTRDEIIDKSNPNYDTDEKAMDDLYSSLDEYDGNNKRQRYNFDEPDFEKHLVDALNRIKYIGNDFHKNQLQHEALNNDNSNVDSNLNLVSNIKNSYDNADINNSNNNNMNEGDKSKVENYEIDEFGNLNRKHHAAKVDSNGKDFISLKFHNKKHKNNFKRNEYNAFHPSRRNGDTFHDKDKDNNGGLDVRANYDSTGNDNIDYYENEFLMRNNRRDNKNNLKDDDDDSIDNRKAEEEISFNKESVPFNHGSNNNVLHASLKKHVDKNYFKHVPPFDENDDEIMKYKRNLRAIRGVGGGTNLDYGADVDDDDDNYKKLNPFDAGNGDLLKSLSEESIKRMKTTRKNKKKRSEKLDKCGSVNNNVSDKITPKQYKNNSNDKDKSRSRRKQDEIKIVSNALDGGNSNSKTPNFNNKLNNNNNYNNINNNEMKLVKVKDDRIHLNLAGGNSGLRERNDLAQLVMDSNVSRFVTGSTIAFVSTQLATVEVKSKGTPRGYHTPGAVQSAAVAGCPYGFHSTTQSPGSRRKLVKAEGFENLRGVYVAPQLKFNVSSNSTDDIRVAHEINDFVANLLFNAGKTGNMRKELGLCKGYDKRLPFHINKPIDDKLLKGLMECLSNIIKGSLENQKCSEMPSELKIFVDWLLLNGISARDEFRQFMASDSSQRKLFLFAGEGVCDKTGIDITTSSAVLSITGTGNNTSSNSTSTVKDPLASLDHPKSNGKPAKIFGTLKKLYYSPSNIFSNHAEKTVNKNPYNLFKRYLGDRKFYLSPSDIYDQKIYQNSPEMYNNIAQQYNTENDANDWNVKSPSLFESSDNENEVKYNNDPAILGPPGGMDLSQFYNDKPAIRKKMKRQEHRNVLEFETPVDGYDADDE